MGKHGRCEAEIPRGGPLNLNSNLSIYTHPTSKWKSPDAKTRMRPGRISDTFVSNNLFESTNTERLYFDWE